MINSQLLLTTLKSQLADLLADLHHQVDTVPEIGEALRSEYQRAFDAERTGWTFTEWADDRLTQVAVGWLLGCVFVRYGEDNGLIDDPMIGGSGNAAALARAAQQDYFRANPTDSDREYLQHAFRKAASLPGLDGVLGERRSPLWLTDPSADACTEMLALFRRTDDDGELVLDFTDPTGDTRFLGDLYQDLSEHAKKTYALLQTPDFVEEFILDRTLDPAIESVGLAQVSIIDPTCGSGHFLLGAFERLWQRWTDAEPAMPADQRAAKALDAVWGVDINPFAAAIARFRLLVAAMQRADQKRLADVRDYPIHVTVGDSLLWGGFIRRQLPGAEGLGVQSAYAYRTENAEELRVTLGNRYSAVVGNPPYIRPSDKQASDNYRSLWDTCYGQYPLGVPFTEFFFELASPGQDDGGPPAGFVGLIVGNQFMKNKFGRPLVQDFLCRRDLTHIVDTADARIPGHETPTVILFGRNQRPIAEAVRAVQGIRGERSSPSDPSKGRVWSAIIDQIDEPGTTSDYVSVADVPRGRLAAHPWNIGGGGAAEVKDRLDSRSSCRLGDLLSDIGACVVTREDKLFQAGTFARRAGAKSDHLRPLVAGGDIRDWATPKSDLGIWPYDPDSLEATEDDTIQKVLWPWRSQLAGRVAYGKTQLERGLCWWEYSMFFRERFRGALAIVFAFKATHNHFALVERESVFKQTAPVLKLRDGASVDDHLSLTAMLNSSVANFWIRQVCQAYEASEQWAARFERSNGAVEAFPVLDQRHRDALAEPGRVLDHLGRAMSFQDPASVMATMTPTRERLDAARAGASGIWAEMVSAQEELDWLCMELYGLVDESLLSPAGKPSVPPLALGERAFEIVLARQVAAGDIDTEWFAEHGSEPLTELPAHWPDWYRDLVDRRIELIESDRNVGLVERPEHKRRWEHAAWDDLEQAALRDWLLDRLEDRMLWFDRDFAVTRTVAQLTDRLSTDEEWMSVARLYVGQVDVDPLAVVTGLVADEHVPAQASARYKPSGRKKRVEWERTWELQRAEDRGGDVERIAVPPKYKDSDFVRPSYWKQRDKLDVPKERFASVIGAERDASSGDSTMVLAWAGFDHAHLAQALATLLYQRQTVDGWTGDQLLPLLAALDEVLPWVEQWHPEVAPGLGQPLAAFYRGQLDQVLTSIGATIDEARAWVPPAPTRGRNAAAKKAEA